MQTGWFKSEDGKWYFLYPNGAMAVKTVIDGRTIGEDGVWVPNEGDTEPTNTMDLENGYLVQNMEGITKNGYTIISSGKTSAGSRWGNAIRLKGKGSYVQCNTNGEYRLLSGVFGPSSQFDSANMARITVYGDDNQVLYTSQDIHYNEKNVYFGVDDIKRELNNKHYDAYFLDIELGADNGVELAKNIKQSDINSIVVFTTSHTDYMAEAFDVHAFNYIVKPVTMQKVDKIVTQLEEVINSRDDKLIFRCNRELVSTYYDDIVYMESSKRIINLITTNMEYQFYGKINDVYNELPELIFGKTRSGCIVNYRYVSRVDKSNVWCRRGVDGKEIRLDLGRGRYNDFMTDYTSYITSERGKRRRLW